MGAKVRSLTSFRSPCCPASWIISASSPAKTRSFAVAAAAVSSLPLLLPPLVILSRDLPPEGLGVKAWLLRSSARPSFVYMPAVAVCQEPRAESFWGATRSSVFSLAALAIAWFEGKGGED